MCLSDRLMDEAHEVRKEAMISLKKMAQFFRPDVNTYSGESCDMRT